MKIIHLVEDNQSIRELLEVFLTGEGYSVQAFETIKDFNFHNLSNIPQLYLFDVMLPDGSGFDLCNEIKNGSFTNSIPVIMMSANAKIDQIANHCAPDDFISKPFDLNDLLKRINHLIK